MDLFKRNRFTATEVSMGITERVVVDQIHKAGHELVRLMNLGVTMGLQTDFSASRTMDGVYIVNSIRVSKTLEPPKE